MQGSKYLYIWLEGKIADLPQIHVKIEDDLALTEFRDKYVDINQSYVIVRVKNAGDEQGHPYTLVVQPADTTPDNPPEPAETEEKLIGTSLTLIKGVGRKISALFQQYTTVNSLETLRQAGATARGRQKLAKQINKSPELILQWVQLADLMRLNGVGEDYSALLWQAGITGIEDLKQQKPASLATLLDKTNLQYKKVNRLPSLDQVKDWITQAKTMLPGVYL